MVHPIKGCEHPGKHWSKRESNRFAEGRLNKTAVYHLWIFDIQREAHKRFPHHPHIITFERPSALMCTAQCRWKNYWSIILIKNYKNDRSWFSVHVCQRLIQVGLWSDFFSWFSYLVRLMDDECDFQAANGWLLLVSLCQDANYE